MRCLIRCCPSCSSALSSPAEHADSFSWVGRSLFNELLDNLPLELFAVGCCNCEARAAMRNRPEAKAMISPTLNRRLPPIRNPSAMVRRPVIQATRIKPITENHRQAHPQATSRVPCLGERSSGRHVECTGAFQFTEASSNPTCLPATPSRESMAPGPRGRPRKTNRK